MLRMSLYTYIPIYIRSTHAGLSCYSITRNHINPMNSLSTSQSWPILTGFLIFNTETQLTNLVTQTEKRCTQTNANNQKKKKKQKNTLTHSPGSLAMMVYSIFDGDDNDADETKTKPTTNQ